MKLNAVWIRVILFFWMLFITSFNFAQPQSSDLGTIIVSYQTDQEGQRLDRIRFWLINENQERTLYPQKDEFVTNNHTCSERTVVIAHLPIGLYRIEFLIPNVDQIFEEVPPRDIELTPGSVIKIDQFIRLRTSPNEISDLATSEYDPLLTQKLPAIIVQKPRPLLFPYPSATPPVKATRFSLKSNLNARWRLMHDGQVIYSSQGSISDLPIPPDSNYYLLAEEVPGHAVEITPPNPFDLKPGQIFIVSLSYRLETGYLEIQGSWPGDAPLIVYLEHEHSSTSPLKIKIKSIGGKISWQSDSLPIGEYLVKFKASNQAEPIEKRSIRIRKGLRSILTFPSTPEEFPAEGAGSLHITADIPQALYTLFDEKGNVIGQGQGYSYSFDNLDPGEYEIKFSSADPRLFIPPPSQSLTLTGSQKAEIKVNYEKMGRLTIGSNVDTFQVIIKSQQDDQTTLHKTISGKSQNYYLPEGQYIIVYEPLKPGMKAPKSTTIAIRSTAPQTVYQSYSLDEESSSILPSKDSTSGIDVKTNLSEASYTLQIIEDSQAKNLKKYKGKKNFIPVATSAEYRLVFNPIPNYATPEPITLKLNEGDRTLVEANYVQSDAFVTIPAGFAIIGDPFSDNMENVRPAKEITLAAFEIATYEVTNLQFADWLSHAFKNKRAFWNPARPGYITDADGLILCKTMEASPLSQISLQADSSGAVFAPIPGKEHYPVIEVTWYGAQAYCLDKGYRLPTENEWEKAAGMSLNPPKRYKYGFGQDYIDRTWANYREFEAPLGTIQVLTTPVGFYNGTNILPLKARDRRQLATHNAKSPFGAYDMSGNVWEWVSTSDDANIWSNKRIVKGGCYDSLEQGVRIAERLALSPEHSDIYTGFRPARSIQN